MTRQMRKVLSQPGRHINTPFQTKLGHDVRPDPGGLWFNVTSGRTGLVYRVTPTGGQEATCTCVGYEKTKLPCSHVAAVIEYASVVLFKQQLDKVKRA